METGHASRLEKPSVLSLARLQQPLCFLRAIVGHTLLNTPKRI